MRIPSFQSAGIWPVLHTRLNKKCNARAIGTIAYFSNSAAMPSEPGARPLRNLLMALVTSSRVGSLTEMEESAGAEVASSSRVVLGTPAGWFRAFSKCSRQRSRVSSPVSHGEP